MMHANDILPTIAFSKDFMAMLKLEETAAYALKPVFAARCEKYSTTKRFLERAIVITQDGQFIVFDTSDKVLRITHRIQIGKERSHKKLILQVDRAPTEKDGKQSIRLLTEPLSPTGREEPKYNPFDNNETEEEFHRRMRDEATARGELLPDEDLVLTFHCKRAPVVAQLVSIVNHLAQPIGDFFVELQDESVLHQVQDERSITDVVMSLMRGKKASKKAPISLASIAAQQKDALAQAGEAIEVPAPVQAPRLGGAKKSTTVDEFKDGVTLQHIASQAKLLKKKSQGASGLHASGYLTGSDEELEDHLPEYTFDGPDPEEIEARKNRKAREPRKPLDEMSFPSEDDEDDKLDEGLDAQGKRKLKPEKQTKQEQKRAKKEQEKLAKKRKEQEEAEKKKQSKVVLALALAKRESERIAAGYRYSAKYIDEFTEPQPQPLYRAHHKKKSVPLFIIRAPSDEASLTLTSLCFYRRNIVVLLNPALAPEEQDTVGIAVGSSGQFIVCRPEDDDDAAGSAHTDSAGGRGFPMSSIVKCRVEYSNHFCNDQRVGYVTLTIDVDADSAKRRKKRNKRKLKKKEQEAKRRSKKQHQQFDEDGNPMFDDNDESVDGYGDFEDEESADEEDEGDLRTIELDMDAMSCGDMNTEDAECSSIEYFLTVVSHFSPEAVIEVLEPPQEPPKPKALPRPYVDPVEEEARMPPGAVMAARMLSSASQRAMGSVADGGGVADGNTPSDRTIDAASPAPRAPNSVPTHAINAVSQRLALTPSAIKERGDTLRKMIRDHKTGGGANVHVDKNSGEDGTATTGLTQQAEASMQQHRVLTELIFQIAEKRLGVHHNSTVRASSVAKSGSSPSPVGGRGASYSNTRST